MSALNVFYAGHEKCPPGHAFGPAVRQHYLLHMILEGRGIYQTRYSSFPLRKGQAFLIYPGETTYYQADDREPWEYAWVAFNGYEAEEVLEQTCFAEGGYVSAGGFTKKDESRIYELVEAFERSESRLELMGSLCRVLALFGQERKLSAAGYEKQYFEKAVGYIYNNYGYPLKISDLAKYIGIDRTYLYRIFMDIEKCPPKQYLQRFRMKQALQMLSEGGHTVTETAYSCGFRDAASFCNSFKKEMGMTPLQYQAELKLHTSYAGR